MCLGRILYPDILSAYWAALPQFLTLFLMISIMSLPRRRVMDAVCEVNNVSSILLHIARSAKIASKELTGTCCIRRSDKKLRVSVS